MGCLRARRVDSVAAGDQGAGFGQRGFQLAGVFAAAAGVVGASATFTADNGGDLLDQFAGGPWRSIRWRHWR